MLLRLTKLKVGIQLAWKVLWWSQQEYSKDPQVQTAISYGCKIPAIQPYTLLLHGRMRDGHAITTD